MFFNTCLTKGEKVSCWFSLYLLILVEIRAFYFLVLEYPRMTEKQQQQQVESRATENATNMTSSFQAFDEPDDELEEFEELGMK